MKNVVFFSSFDSVSLSYSRGWLWETAAPGYEGMGLIV